MQTLIEQKKQFKEKKTNSLVFILIAVVAILGVSRVLIANQMVGASEKMRNLDQQIQKVESQNEILAEATRQKESLSSLENKTGALGFTKTNKYSFIRPSDPVAFDESLVSF